jgi:pimeloyl-ACP methyl ester carboxylesterase
MFSKIAQLAEIADIIVFDQRGAGNSVPNLTSSIALDLPVGQTLDHHTFLEHYRSRVREAAAFWTERGVDFRGYTTIESADDVNDLRLALNAEKISLYGASYGSHLGLATIRRHGQHIHRAVLSLVEGPDHTVKLPGQIQEHFSELDQRLRADPHWRHRLPSVSDGLAELISRLDQSPVRKVVDLPELGTQEVVIDSFDLRYVFAQLIGQFKSTQLLPARVDDLLAGEYEWLIRRSAAYRTGWLLSLMECAVDSASGVSAARLKRIQTEAPATFLGALADFPLPYVSEACGAWDLGEDFRSPIYSDTPVLFISGTMDPRTPPANAEEVRVGFPSGKHLVVDGMLHENPVCITDAATQIIKFYATGEAEDGSIHTPFTFAESA